MAKVKFVDIVSFKVGSTTYTGMKRIGWSVRKGVARPNVDEGLMFATGIDIVGVQDFPLQATIEHEDPVSALALLALGNNQTVVIRVKAAGGTQKDVTITGASFVNWDANQSRNEDMNNTIPLVAYSADGTTLPISIANVT